MPRVIAALIRHGEYRQLPKTPGAHQPFPLTKKGQKQAQKASVTLRKAIKNNRWAVSAQVNSSRLLRAWQTAQIITGELTDLFPVSPLLNSFDDLAERGLGSAANLTIEQIETIIHEDPRFSDLPPGWKSNSRFCLPLQGAESLLEAGERVASHLDKQMKILIEQTEADTLKLFMGHGAAFRHAAYHLGVLSYEQIAQLSMYHAEPVFLEYLSDGSWQHIDGKWKVRAKRSGYND